MFAKTEQFVRFTGQWRIAPKSLHLFSEAYFGLSQVSVMELFSENIQQLLAIIFFHKKPP